MPGGDLGGDLAGDLGDLAGDLGGGDGLGVDVVKGVKGMMLNAVSLVLELPMGPRMARSIFF